MIATAIEIPTMTGIAIDLATMVETDTMSVGDLIKKLIIPWIVIMKEMRGALETIIGETMIVQWRRVMWIPIMTETRKIQKAMTVKEIKTRNSHQGKGSGITFFMAMICLYEHVNIAKLLTMSLLGLSKIINF
jgi:hypothetical protein